MLEMEIRPTKKTIKELFKKQLQIKGVYVFYHSDFKPFSFKIGCSDNLIRRITDSDYYTAFPSLGCFHLWYTEDTDMIITQLETYILDIFRKNTSEYCQNGGTEAFSRIDDNMNIKQVVNVLDKNILEYSIENKVEFYKMKDPITREFCIDYIVGRHQISFENIYIIDWEIEKFSDLKYTYCSICNRTTKRNSIHHTRFSYYDKDSVHNTTIGKECFDKVYHRRYKVYEKNKLFSEEKIRDIIESEYKGTPTHSDIIEYFINKIFQDGRLCSNLISCHKHDNKLVLVLYVLTYLLCVKQSYTCEINKQFWEELQKFHKSLKGENDCDVHDIHNVIRKYKDFQILSVGYEEGDNITIVSLEISLKKPEFQAENIAHKFLQYIGRLNKNPLPNMNYDIDEEKINFDEEQLKIINKIPGIICGTPGRGKSYIGEQIVKNLSKVLLITPTYSRLQSITINVTNGCKGIVIQSINNGNIQYIATKEYKYIVVDECWMFTIYNFKCLVELISKLELSLEYIYISGDRKQLPVIGFENETKIFWGIVNHKIYEMDYKINNRFTGEIDKNIFIEMYIGYNKIDRNFIRKIFNIIPQDQFMKSYMGKKLEKKDIKVIGYTNKVVYEFNRDISKAVYNCMNCIKDIHVTKYIKTCKECIMKYEWISLNNSKYDKLPSEKVCFSTFIKKTFNDGMKNDVYEYKDEYNCMKRLYVLKDDSDRRLTMMFCKNQKIQLEPYIPLTNLPKEPDYIIVTDLVNYTDKNKTLVIHKDDLQDYEIGYSYCSTIQKAQGETYDNVFFLDTGYLSFCKNPHYYTAFTRARNLSETIIVDLQTETEIKNVKDEHSFKDYIKQNFSKADIDPPKNFRSILRFMPVGWRKISINKITCEYLKNLRTYLNTNHIDY
jgi:hypothetical protein